MRIKYNGPAEQVNVAGYGPHRLGEEKEYPDDFAAELLDTSSRQMFEVVEKKRSKPSAQSSKGKE